MALIPVTFCQKKREPPRKNRYIIFLLWMTVLKGWMKPTPRELCCSRAVSMAVISSSI